MAPQPGDGPLEYGGGSVCQLGAVEQQQEQMAAALAELVAEVASLKRQLTQFAEEERNAMAELRCVRASFDAQTMAGSRRGGDVACVAGVLVQVSGGVERAC